MRQVIEEDYRRYSKAQGSVARYVRTFLSNAGFRAVVLHRLSAWGLRRKYFFLAGICERAMHHLCHCWISASAEIGPGFLIAHVGGIVVGGETRLGRHCDIRQNVTFGGNYNKQGADGRTQPWVGDNVSFGAGAVVIGPIHVGDDVIIGANSVVTRDVPAGMIVSGVPATVVKARWAEETGRKL